MRFSIITVVKNGFPGIISTIKSVFKQSFNDYEHIILDSCSNDGTSQFIKNFKSDKINYHRKTDQGIYFALNRSISKAKGEYIINLHAGDFFYSNFVLKKLDFLIRKNKNIDFFFSNIIYFYKNEVKRVWSIPIKRFNKFSFLKIPHTSLCVKTKITKDLMYNTIYKISSDTEYLIKLNKNYQGKYINFFFVFMEYGGLSTSTKYLFRKIIEDLSILKKEFNYLFLLAWLYKILVKISGYLKSKSFFTLKLIKQKKRMDDFLL
jgi:glycosyltransferase involved in cell wall biosynthesis